MTDDPLISNCIERRDSALANIKLLEQGTLKMMRGNVDASPEHTASLCRTVEMMDSVIDTYGPKGSHA